MANEGLRPGHNSNVYGFPSNLKSGGGGGTFDGMDAVDAKIAAAEARTDAKFAEVLGELKAMRVEMSHAPSTWAMVGTMGGFTVVTITVIAAFMTYGGQMFGLGLDASSVTDQSSKNAAAAVAQQVQPQIDSLATQYERMNLKLDSVIQAVGAKNVEPEKQILDPMPAPFNAPNQ